jgi:hypothetical protein
MKTALTLYTGEDAKKVFNPQAPELAWPKRILDGYIYDANTLAACLQAALGPEAGWTVTDCPTGVLIIACDASGHPWFFCKDNAKNKGKTDPARSSTPWWLLRRRPLISTSGR